MTEVHSISHFSPLSSTLDGMAQVPSSNQREPETNKRVHKINIHVPQVGPTEGSAINNQGTCGCSQVQGYAWAGECLTHLSHEVIMSKLFLVFFSG